jgi:cobalamin biosynthesis protein CbiG
VQRGDEPAFERLGHTVDGRWHLAAGAAHAAVGKQRDTVALAPQHRQRRRQLVQFGHAVGVQALETHDDDQVAGAVRQP